MCCAALWRWQDPAGLHLCCTYRTVGKAQVFLDDLKQVSGGMLLAAWKLKAAPPLCPIPWQRSLTRRHGGLQAVASVRESMAKDGGKKKTGNAAIYGMASSLPAGPIKMMLCTYTDVVLKA